MNKKCWMIFGVVFLLLAPASMPAFGWETIVSFGDSLSDNGDGDGYGHPYGPFSNGDVWLDYLAESMRDVSLEDRAIGGAQTVGPVSNDFDIGMTAQIHAYIDGLPEDADLSAVLFTVWIGGNDFLSMGDKAPGSVIANALWNIACSLQELVDAGAEDILVMNLPDLGLTPLYNKSPEGSALATGLSATFNDNLKHLICDLNTSFPEVKFYMADTFKLLQFAVTQGDTLGLPNVSSSCTGDDKLPDCHGYLFYDDIHPTTATHRYLAALAAGQVKHGRISREMKELLKELRSLHPRKPFIFSCGD
ncbi:hypothetical protein DSLASN_35580 [Desulfoluna limicola]|uniref:Lipolytic protein G-D-S-L family n=1 Tax=Desulfoluna limicola TaxID=2810562 RepID=A0ABN6F8C2_9BACT|nr:SGNH/GDSL hydrolase family protein [Desulfoluna limicola]BCS97926.1 hypothetical protein DSLASN_35580 [Desulfoluna limicola]